MGTFPEDFIMIERKSGININYVMGDGFTFNLFCIECRHINPMYR